MFPYSGDATKSLQEAKATFGNGQPVVPGQWSVASSGKRIWKCRPISEMCREACLGQGGGRRGSLRPAAYVRDLGNHRCLQ